MGLEPTSRDIKGGIVKSDNLKVCVPCGQKCVLPVELSTPRFGGRAKEVEILSNEVPQYAQHSINSLGLPIWNFDFLLC